MAPRELRLDFAGSSYRWHQRALGSTWRSQRFDIDEMMKVHGASLTETLTDDIMQYFKVPLEYQVLCDVEGPLTSSTDIRRVLLGVAPRLWLFDARYMGASLRKQCEQRMEGLGAELGATKSRLGILLPPPPVLGLQACTSAEPPPPPAGMLGEQGCPALGRGASPVRLLPWAVAWPNTEPGCWRGAAPSLVTRSTSQPPVPVKQPQLAVPAPVAAPAARPVASSVQSRSNSMPRAPCRLQAQVLPTRVISPRPCQPSVVVQQPGVTIHTQQPQAQLSRAMPQRVVTVQQPRQHSQSPQPSPRPPENTSGMIQAAQSRPPGPWPSRPAAPVTPAEGAEGSAVVEPTGVLVPRAPSYPAIPRQTLRRRPRAVTEPVEASAFSEGVPAESSEAEVQVLLDKSRAPDRAFGFTNVPAVSSGDQPCLRITEVSEGGLLADWNAQQPDCRIQPGDFILAVNGTSGDVVRMRGLLCSSQVLRLQVCKAAPLKDAAPAPVTSVQAGNSPSSSSRSPPRPASSEEVFAKALQRRPSDLQVEVRAQDRRIRELEEQISGFQRLAAASAANVSEGLSTAQPDKGSAMAPCSWTSAQPGASDDGRAVQEEFEALKRQEHIAARLAVDRNAEIQALQHELEAAREAALPGAPASAGRVPLWQRLTEDSLSPGNLVPSGKAELSWEAVPTSLEALEAEEEMLLKSVRQALTKITSRPASAQGSRASPSRTPPTGLLEKLPVSRPRTPPGIVEKDGFLGRLNEQTKEHRKQGVLSDSLDSPAVPRQESGALWMPFSAGGCDDGQGSDDAATLRGGESWPWKTACGSDVTAPPAGQETSRYAPQPWAMAGLSASHQSLRSSALQPPEFFSISSPQYEGARCPHCGAVCGEEALYCQRCGQKREAKASLSRLPTQAADDELAKALAAAEHKRLQEERSSSEWRERARVLAEDALSRERLDAEFDAQRRCKQLEAEVELRNRDVQRLEEWKELQKKMHEVEMQHQAELLELKHRSEVACEQEQWQQMEILSNTAMHERSELAQEQEIQELVFCVEAERRASAEAQQGSKKAASMMKDLSARLAGRDLEILALESAFAERRQPSNLKAVEQAEQQAAELAEKSRRQAEELAESRQREAQRAEEELAESRQREAQRAEEVGAMATREKSLERSLARLEAEMEELARRSHEPAPAPPKPVEEVPTAKLEYVATGDDELDQQLEKQLADLGPGTLKGNVLTRTGPKKYKLGDQKVFMQLSDGVVKVREGGGYVLLSQWTKEITAPGEQGAGHDDPFGALDAASPFAAHG